MYNKIFMFFILLTFIVASASFSFASDTEMLLKTLLNKDVITKSEYRKLKRGMRTSESLEQRVADIVKYLKKEYKNVTGNTVSLTKEGEVDVLVQSTSRVHSWAQVYQKYLIGGMGEAVVVEEGSTDRVPMSWREFLDQGGWKGKRPQNDTRPKPGPRPGLGEVEK